MAAKEFSTQVRVYIEDTDAGGVVYYVNYLKFMERARSDFLRSLGFAKPALLTDDLLLMVASAHVDYKRSAKLDDLLSVTASVSKVARSYVVFSQFVRKSITGADEQGLATGCIQDLATGSIQVACVNKNTMKPVSMPASLREILIEYQGE